MKYYFWIKFQVRPKRILAKKSRIICFIFKFPFNFPRKKPSFLVKSCPPIAYYGEKVIIISYFSQKVDIIWNNYDSNRIWSRGWWWGDPRSILYTPVVVRSSKLSSIEPRRYLDGRPARDAKGGEFPSFAAIFLKTCFKKQKFSLKVVKLINW